MTESVTFPTVFQDYLRHVRTAHAQNLHHDYRRGLFLTFLDRAFGIKTEDVSVEQFLRIDIRRRGWIDALFRDLVFEFKRDLELERSEGLRELQDYLRTLAYGNESYGLLTDGLLFEVYRLDETLPSTELRRVDTFDLTIVDAEAAFLWLDSYLFSQKHVPPTSADLVRRFGLQSPTYQAVARTLSELLQKIVVTPELDVKRQQWRGVLAKVYGSDIGSDELFVRHTFLNQFAKLLAYASLAGIPRQDTVIAAIVSGDAFHRFGVSNLGEIDFFAWILDREVRTEALYQLEMNRMH